MKSWVSSEACIGSEPDLMHMQILAPSHPRSSADGQGFAHARILVDLRYSSPELTQQNT
jgi:hypothetical protein